MSRFDPTLDSSTQTLVSPSAALVLPGGRIALLIERARWPLPTMGTVEGAGTWTALSWKTENGYAIVALLPAMPQHEARLLSRSGEPVARLARPGHIDVSAAPLIRMVKRTGAEPGSVFAFLNAQLSAVAPGIVGEFLTGAAERAGFIEVTARTECGGFYLQGWAQAMQSGRTHVIGLGSFERHEMALARFEREDILPPASGVCLFAKCVAPDMPIPEAIYFEREGRLGRLDIVPAPALEGPAATGHIRAMLDRIEGPGDVTGAFARVCRPRYEGVDTLSSYAGPVAAAFDRVLRAADGKLLVSGWLLDPLSRVELVMLKSRTGLYAPLHQTWNLLPRPDLNKGFAGNPRFAGLLDEREVLHGFIAHAPASPAASAEDVYLELVLDDGTCLFRPVEVTACQGEGVLPAILAGLSPDEPELPQIVEGHLAPFLAGVARPAKALRRIARPTPLGDGPAGREVDAVMPVTRLDELQPVFAMLAGSADADRLDLTLVVGRGLAAEIRGALDDAFRFYGLGGRLLVVPDHATLAARLDAGIAATEAARVLVWQPAALPRDAGWLARLIDEADGAGAGLVSPMLTYEDGSVYFGGDRPDPTATQTPCLRAGLGAAALEGGETRPALAGAAEVFLVDRDLLDSAGGVSGHLFGDAYTHLDLAARLRRAGGHSWCAPAVTFWMLEEPATETESPYARMTRAIDAALIARKGMTAGGIR